MEIINFIKDNPLQAVGIVFIVLNIPLGWLLGIGFFTKLAVEKQRAGYIAIGLIIYGISWVMLIAGIYLCGESFYEKLYAQYHLYIKAVAGITVIIAFIIVKKKFREVLILLKNLRNKKQ
jgi:hypothetical protein